MCSSKEQRKKRSKVLSFIEQITIKYPKEIKDVFSNGYCFWFAIILRERFHGEIWFNSSLVHFATCIEDRLFDVNGMIDDTYGWMPWTEFQERNHYEAQQVIRTVIKKV